MSKKWDGKSKAGVLGYQIFIVAIKTFGLYLPYFLLYFTAAYYYLFVPKAKKPILWFYKNVLKYPHLKAHLMTYKNFVSFGKTLIDRIIFQLGQGEKFTFECENKHYLVEMRDNGKGGILLSAHVGNWETAGNMLKDQITSKINVVMLDAEVEAIKEYMQKSTGGSRFNIIPIKDDLSHVIKIKMALDNNEFVAIHADRIVPDSKTIECNLLGQTIKLPAGPFIIASKFNAPVTFVYSNKESNTHYHLSATKPIYDKMTPEAIAGMYVAELERKVKLYPDQWFNYFDYFAQ